MMSAAGRCNIALCLGLCGFTAAAQAQSQVTLYGVVDLGVEIANGGRGTAERLVSGNITPSRFGFSGSDDLGGETRAVFKLENGLTANTGKANQGGALFGREDWVGVDGPWGKMIAGVTYTPMLTILGTYSLPADSDGLGWGHGVNNFAGPATRTSNSVRYTSPTLDGFILRGDYGFPGVSGNQPGNIGRTVSESVGYRNGALSADFAYMTQVFAAGASITAASPSAVADYVSFGISYDFGFIKPAFVYIKNSGGPDVPTINSATFSNPHSSQFEIDATIPQGRALWLLSVGQFKKYADRNGNATDYGIRYNYALSRTVIAYAGYAGLINGSNAAFTIKGQSDGGAPVATGGSARAILIGMQKAF